MVAGLVLTILQALWLMLPAYLANMSAVFVGGGTPIDFGKNWKDGRRILGNGKTWRGLLLGPAVAAALTVALHYLARVEPFAGWGLYDFGPLPWVVLLAYLVGFGALAGDSIESFFKRRLGKERGAPWFPFDQLDFVVGAWALGLASGFLLAPLYGYNWFLQEFTFAKVLAILVLTPGLHFVVNVIGYKLGKKEVPW